MLYLFTKRHAIYEQSVSRSHLNQLLPRRFVSSQTGLSKHLRYLRRKRYFRPFSGRTHRKCTTWCSVSFCWSFLLVLWFLALACIFTTRIFFSAEPPTTPHPYGRLLRFLSAVFLCSSRGERALFPTSDVSSFVLVIIEFALYWLLHALKTEEETGCGAKESRRPFTFEIEN